MRARDWSAILSATVDIDNLIATQLNRPARSSSARGADPLAVLYSNARTRVQRLISELDDIPDRDMVVLLMVLFFDERIVRYLNDDDRPRWPFLQMEWIKSQRGGEEFFRIAQQVLSDNHPPRNVVETLYHCLQNGFVGRFASDPRSREEITHKLRARLITPTNVGPRDMAPTNTGRLGQLRWPGWYYLSAAAAAVALTGLLVSWSNHS
ncbi:MAG: DotU family type IV/VI secretion system protein [Myxococcota bacterium]